MRPLLFAATSTIAAALSGPVAGQEIERQHDSHVHGKGTLQIAIDGNVLHARLESPADNLFGFEHAPANPRQQEVIDAATALLESGATLMSTLEVRCALENAVLELPFGAADKPDSGAQRDAETVDHEHVHDHHDHADHGDEEAHATVTHSDVAVDYHYRCDAAPAGVRLALFTHFPAFESIDVQWISDAGQGSARATADTPEIRFDR